MPDEDPRGPDWVGGDDLPWDTDPADDLDTLITEASSALPDLNPPTHINPADIEIIPPRSRSPKVRKAHQDDLATTTALAPRAKDYVEPWARLVDESDLSWERFVFYRDLGLNRTITTVAERFGVTGFGNQPSIYHWRDRARAYDEHLDRIHRAELELAIRQMADRHAEMMEKALVVLQTPFLAIAHRMETDPKFIDSLSKEKVGRLLDLTAKIARVMPPMMNAERLARGMPTDIQRVEGTIEHEHVIRADREQLAAIAVALGAAGVLDVGGGDSQPLTFDDSSDDQVHDLDPVEE